MRIALVDATTLKRFQPQLSRLEGAIPYPIDNGADSFTIDHGSDYTAFFTGLGEPAFLVALDGDRLVGIVCGVVRSAAQNGVQFPTVYGSALKLAPEVRGTGLWKRMLWRGFFLTLRPSFLKRFKMAYVAAMMGERGDVMRSAKGFHAARLARRSARLAIYFVAPERLAQLDPTGGPPPPTGGGLDFSPDAAETALPPGWITTAGRKDLRLRSTGQPWPLIHLPLGPSAWIPTLGAYLQRCGAALVAAERPGPCCFSLDQRLAEQIDWLGMRGIVTDTVCTVYGFRLPGGPRAEPWVHLATSQI